MGSSLVKVSEGGNVVRLTRQRWDTLDKAMCYWEAEVENMEIMDDPDAVRERKRFESALEYLLSIKPKGDN